MNKLFIIDLMPFLYKGHFVFLRNPRMTSSGLNTSALLGLANGLQSILRHEKPTHAVLAMDPGGPTFRHKAYAPYKAQREKMPEDLAASIPWAFELAEALRIPVVRVEGFEADDVMGTLAVKGAAAGFDVYMATPDKDAAQLVRPGVKLYRPPHAGGDADIYDEAKVCEHWKLSSPAQMIDYLALAGDASDNIPGIRGVGEKTAVDLLSKFGTVEGIIENVSKIKGKLQEKVFAGKEDATISKFLTTIRTDVPIDPNWDDFRLGEPDRGKLAAVCAKFELNRLAKDFGIESGSAGPLFAAAAPSAQKPAAPQQGADAPKAASEPPVPLSTIDSVPHDYRLVSDEDDARALLEELMKCDRIAFDTETAAWNGHESTDAHNCKLVGFSFATAPGKAWYVTADMVDIFRPLFADLSKTFVGHNVKFDRSVLHRSGIGFATVPRDTMLEHYCLDAAARHGMDALSEQYLHYRPIPITALIGEKERGKEQLQMSALKPEQICDYAAEDADVTLRLDDALRPLVVSATARASEETGLRVLEDVEEPLVKILTDMEREGVKIDVEALKEYGQALDRDILGLRMEILSYADPGFNPDSPKQLGVLLFEKLGLEGGRKTSTGQYSTDEKVLSKLASAHPVVGKILEYRACTKLKSTYVDKLPTLIDANGRVHTTYAQAFTETGRLSSSDPNLQNIPIRTERGKLIRKAFVARDEKHVLISADYSQIELRLMAAFSRDSAMMTAFRNGEDIHRDTASRVFNVMPAFVTPEQRSQCKMVNFGIIYGISAFGLSQRLKVPRKEASNLIDTYFRLYPSVRKYMEKAIAEAREKGYAETVLGRRRTLRDINSRNATARSAAERDAINTPIQGSAADLIKVAMVKVDRALRAEGLRAKMVLQIHDELVFDTPVEEVDKVKEIVKREMTSAMDFGVPLDVGIGVGSNWLDAH
ncbi:MAG: DNA polymerase I [Lentisphaerae bacterium]|nr:DNA polymerase I [Lentisphaerota bacterium]